MKKIMIAGMAAGALVLAGCGGGGNSEPIATQEPSAGYSWGDAYDDYYLKLNVDCETFATGSQQMACFAMNKAQVKSLKVTMDGMPNSKERSGIVLAIEDFQEQSDKFEDAFCHASTLESSECSFPLSLMDLSLMTMKANLQKAAGKTS